MIRGTTALIAHIGWPTDAFKAPMIYNPYFEHAGIDAVVVPMGCKAENYPAFLRAVFTLENIRGALITMPHKVTTTSLVDELTPTARIAGACNAILRRPDGSLLGDMFDGAGFVRGIGRKGFDLAGTRAGRGLRWCRVSYCCVSRRSGNRCHQPIRCPRHIRGRAGVPPAQPLPSASRHHRLERPANFDLVVNATPLGMNEGDPMPIDVSRIEASTFVGEVVMKEEMTAFLRAQACGLPLPGGSRHAVRADTRLPGVFRLPEHHAGSPAFGRQAELLIAQQQACQLRLPEAGDEGVSDNYHPEM